MVYSNTNDFLLSRAFRSSMKNIQPETTAMCESRLTACGRIVCLTVMYIYGKRRFFLQHRTPTAADPIVT